MFLTIFITFASLIGLIIIHEFGHFVLAKKFGAKVEEFGIGYPPRLIGKKIGETVYSLNFLPFGAFVKIRGEQGEVEDYRSFAGKPMWQRYAIVLGGVVSFWVVAAVILSIVAGIWGLPPAFNPLPWYKAPIQGIEATGKLTYFVIQGWIMGLKDVLGIAELPEGVEMEFFGPLGIFGLLQDYLAMGINYFLFLLSLIAVALALVNILPIPALDGGKLVFLTIELIRGRPVNPKVEQKITAVFFVSLIILMFFITIKFDIPRLF